MVSEIMANQFIFQLFCQSLAIGMLSKQIPLMFSKAQNHLNNAVMCIWFYFASIRLVEAWFQLEDIYIPSSLRSMVLVTNIAADLILVYILYVSMARTIALLPFTRIASAVQKSMYPLLGIMLTVRISRNIWIVFSKPTTGSLWKENIHFATVLIILILRIILDIKSYTVLVSTFCPRGTNSKRIERVNSILIRLKVSLFIEIFLTIFIIVIQFLNVANLLPQTYGVIALLYGWVISSYITHRDYLKELFEPSAGDSDMFSTSSMAGSQSSLKSIVSHRL